MRLFSMALNKLHTVLLIHFIVNQRFQNLSLIRFPRRIGAIKLLHI